MKRKPLVIVIFLLTVILIGYLGYNYVMYGGARDLSTEEADFTVSSKSISDEFATNIDASNKKYLEKAVAIKGTITAATAKELTLDNTIICTLKYPNTSFKNNQSVTVKGRVVGYDDLMGELKLDQCFSN